jgi:hypothetical protein
MPWQLLELDPTTATAKDVKRAYAKRLKTCRPDQDPEGFRQLHEAYTAAIGELQWREHGYGSPTDAEPLAAVENPKTDLVEATSEVIAPPPLSEGLCAVVDTLDRLEEALKEGREGIATLVREVEAIAKAHPSELQRWGEILQDLIRKHGKHEELRLKPEALLFELEHNCLAATLAVIDRLDRQGIPRAINGLCELLAANRVRIQTPAGGIASAQLAGVAAFWMPGKVNDLANLAYEILASGERDFYMQIIDNHAQMRTFLAGVPKHLVSFLRQRLMNVGGSEVWDDEDGTAALNWLKTPQARAGPVYEAIRNLLPEKLDLGRVYPESVPRTRNMSSFEFVPKKREPQQRPRAAPIRSQPLHKYRDNFDWNIEDDNPKPTEPKPRSSTATNSEPRSSPKPRSKPDNWLEEENQTSRGSIKQATLGNSRRKSSKGNLLWVIIIVSILIKLIAFVIHMSITDNP